MALAALASVAAACGSEIKVAEKDPLHRGAVLFRERCSGCHTLEAAGSEGSRPERQTSGGERTNGPNFDSRKESYEDALFAIRNGGFSGAIMPANIVVGEDAEVVARFLAEHSGKGKPTISGNPGGETADRSSGAGGQTVDRPGGAGGQTANQSSGAPQG